jgi:ribose 5-phosphate isomerase A
MDVDAYKRAAAARAVDLVRAGMRLGLGTGSTAAAFVELLAERVRGGLDLTVDGADEIAPDLTLIKGGGGALLREKVVASASVKMVVIADESKLVPVLGRFPLPIEILPFGATATRRAVEAAAAAAGCPGPAPLRLTQNGHAFVTDGGHWLLDAQLQRIADPPDLANRLAGIPGVMEHGLFIGLAGTAIVAGPHGVRLVERP